MKKDTTPTPLLPFTPEEEADLHLKIDQLTGPALSQYIDSAQSALRNKALAPSWRPRVELGLKLAQAARVSAASAEATVAVSS